MGKTILLQLILFCALFTLMVKLAVGNSALNGLYFYPKPVQEKVFKLGLTDRESVARKRKRFMIPFFLVMLGALVLIIGVWNRVSDFKTAYLLSLLFLELMNWYDGLVIDRLWVGHSRFWIIPGTEEIPFVQTWPQVLKKRGTFALHDIFSAAKYGDMEAFVSLLRRMGYEKVELIDTTNGMFMSPWEAKWMALSGSALMVGKK